MLVLLLAIAIVRLSFDLELHYDWIYYEPVERGSCDSCERAPKKVELRMHNLKREYAIPVIWYLVFLENKIS